MPPDPPAYRAQLPPPPSTNNLFVNIYGKGRIKGSRYKRWIDEAAKMMLAAGSRPRIAGPVRVVIEGAIRGDIDNVKAIPDLLVTMGVLIDDKQMDHFEVIRRREGEFVTVSIWRME